MVITVTRHTLSLPAGSWEYMQGVRTWEDETAFHVNKRLSTTGCGNAPNSKGHGNSLTCTDYKRQRHPTRDVGKSWRNGGSGSTPQRVQRQKTCRYNPIPITTPIANASATLSKAMSHGISTTEGSDSVSHLGPIKDQILIHAACVGRKAWCRELFISYSALAQGEKQIHVAAGTIVGADNIRTIAHLLRMAMTPNACHQRRWLL